MLVLLLACATCGAGEPPLIDQVPFAPTGLMRFMRMPVMLKEMEVTDSQLAQLRELWPEYERELNNAYAMRFQGGEDDRAMDRRHERIELKYRPQLERILLKEQLRRARQVWLQGRIELGRFFMANTMDALKINLKQRESIKAAYAVQADLIWESIQNNAEENLLQIFIDSHYEICRTLLTNKQREMYLNLVGDPALGLPGTTPPPGFLEGVRPTHAAPRLP